MYERSEMYEQPDDLYVNNYFETFSVMVWDW